MNLCDKNVATHYPGTITARVTTRELQEDLAGVLGLVQANKTAVEISLGDPRRNECCTVVAVLIPAEEYRAYRALRAASEAIKALGQATS